MHGKRFRVKKASAVSLDRAPEARVRNGSVSSPHLFKRDDAIAVRELPVVLLTTKIDLSRQLYTHDGSIVHGEINLTLLTRSGFNFSPVHQRKVNVWKGNTVITSGCHVKLGIIPLYINLLNDY